jgi:cellulose synthase/poly-beta-1,6-N-acetylglucosamine synthase-like glycosyltransferase
VRWQRGLFQVLLRNADMLFRPRYGLVGSLLLPYLWLFELLEPIVELSGYISLAVALALHVMTGRTLLYLLAIGLTPAILISMASVLLEDLTFRRYQNWADVRRLLLYCIWENFPYRQLHLYWRMKGLVQYFGRDGSWGIIQRAGVASSRPATASVQR